MALPEVQNNFIELNAVLVHILAMLGINILNAHFPTADSIVDRFLIKEVLFIHE